MVKICIHFLYLLRRQIWKENTMVTFQFKAQCTYFKSLNVFELCIFNEREKIAPIVFNISQSSQKRCHK